MTVRVFLSYRRSDSRDVAGRLRDRLAEAFGEENVFFDVDSIDFGLDFRVVIRDMLQNVDAVVALIGPKFDIVRLNQTNDHVRAELLEALEQETLVIPVLIGDAAMPTAEQLPADLVAFSYLNAAPLRPDPDFRRDATRLVESLRRTVSHRSASSGPFVRATVSKSPNRSETQGAEQMPAPSATTARSGSAAVELRTLERRHKGTVLALAFSPDGATLASGSADKTVRLWNVATGEQTYTLTGHKRYVLSVAYSPIGTTLASGSTDRTIRLWDVVSGEQTGTLKGHDGSIQTVAFSPDGRVLASAGYNTPVRLWDPATGDPVGERLDRHDGSIETVAFSPDGGLLAFAGDDMTVRLWDLAVRQQTRSLTGHNAGVLSVAFSPDGAILASGSGDKSVRLWDVATGKQIRTLTGHNDFVRSVAFSPDGAILVSGSGDKSVRLWDVATGKQTQVLTGHNNYVYSVALSPDGATFASAGGVIPRGDSQIRVWRIVR